METRRFYAQYISEKEFKEFLQDRKPLRVNDYMITMLEPVEYYDSDSFRCKIVQHHANSVISGRDQWRYLTDSSYSNITYLIDFRKGKKVYFTSDGISFFKLLNVRTLEKDKILEFNLKLVQSFQFIEPDRSFMIMPFRDKKLNGFYRDHIQSFLKKKLNIDVYRSDDFSDTDVIIDTIYREIEKAEFVICEISECNKNVFFEIGYAKAHHKELIFLLQRGVEHKFFDVAHIRRIDYDLDNPEELQAKLTDTINTIRERK